MSLAGILATPGVRITPLRRAEIPELSQFLISTDRDPPTTVYRCSQEVLAWKYFDGPGGPSEHSVSSLIARSAGRIIGHIGLSHRQFIVRGHQATPVSTMHGIDWRASDAHPGVGYFLMLQAFATSKTQYAIGGSEQAQAVFPRLGFEDQPKLAIFRKVLAPFHRLRATDQGRRHKWPDTVKDMVSVWRGRTPPVQQTVELRSAPTFTQEIDSIQQHSSLRIVTCRHDHLLLNYFLRCPLAGFSGWTIHISKRMIGFAVLRIAAHGRIQHGRIADCWLDTDDPSYWQTAVAALIDRLRALFADDVTCYATTPSLHAALLWNGFAKARERNVCVRDKQQSLPRDIPLGLTMLEGDYAILSGVD
jgi:hypothetical protein